MPVLTDEPQAVGDRTVSPPFDEQPDAGFSPASFAPTRPGVIAAIGFGLACFVWLAAGERLPGGRWIVVHIFTLGVLTTLIWSFSQHLAVALTATPDDLPSPTARPWRSIALSVAIVGMLAGRAFDVHVLLAVGSLGIIAIVGGNLWRLRQRRREAATDRARWSLQQYAFAHVAFVIAAALGGALGAGWIPTPIFAAVRDAHIHLNVLGWGGLTVLATLTVLGPSLLQVAPDLDAERRSAAAMRLAAAGLAVAAAGFVVTGAAGGVGPPVLPVGGLLLYTYGAVVVSRSLLAAARRSDRSPLRWAMGAALAWLLVALGADVIAVAGGLSGWSSGLGIVLLVGVLGQLVLTVLVYVAPVLRRRRTWAREQPPVRIERLARTRTGLLNLGVALAAGAQAVDLGADLVGALLGRVGWSLIALGVLLHVVAMRWPTGGEPTPVAPVTPAPSDG